MKTRTMIPLWKALICSGMLPILVLACGSGTREETDELDRAATSEEPTPPSLSEIGNSTITGIYEDPVQLHNAVYEGEPVAPGAAGRPRVQLLDTYVTGDLDGAPGAEAAVILVENSGGSGSFVYVAVMGRNADGVVNLGTGLVGDRVQIRGARIEADILSLDVLQAGPGDPMCCPGELATRTWKLVDGDLLEVPSGVPTSRLVS